MLKFEIDGQELEVPQGTTIIEAADDAGIRIPRFCYHRKLSVAANCRMCLVEVEKSRKPLPACATPVMDGMKVWTQSENALAYQKAVMEFLLINHPLDCPVCDQGGECELQDVALGYGQDISRYSEGKRVVKDKDIGPLISTEMTRCIHCTRCVRFGQEIAGMRELGAVGRGEHTEIGTYIKHSVSSELSGNVIDLCPVGALTAKPSRFAARAWELEQHASIATHDGVGSNIYAHTRRGKIMRVEPRENESINENWISDKDRFSYEGIYAEDRLLAPLVKAPNWQDATWEEALRHTADTLKIVLDTHGPESIGVLVSPNATLEEAYLAQKLFRSLGCQNIDHRLLQQDFSHQEEMTPGLGMSIAEFGELESYLFIGSNIRHEQPILGHRVRQATLQQHANVYAVNAYDYNWHFDVNAKAIVAPHHMVETLAGLVKALADAGVSLPQEAQGVVSQAQTNAHLTAIAEGIKAGEKVGIFLGEIAERHPQAGDIYRLAQLLTRMTGAKLGLLFAGANSMGAWVAGAVPHRQAGNSQSLTSAGKNAVDMFDQPCKAYVLIGAEPKADFVNSAQVAKALNQAEFVLALTPFASEDLKAHANVLLPVSTSFETSGTVVNLEGTWQSFVAAVPASGEARPAWKVLRVLGNLLKVPDFDYMASTDVKAEISKLAEGAETPTHPWVAPSLAKVGEQVSRLTYTPIYRSDNVVRRAQALQASPLTPESCEALIAPALAERLGMKEKQGLRIQQQEGVAKVAVRIDERVPDNTVMLPATYVETAELGDAIGMLEIQAD